VEEKRGGIERLGYRRQRITVVKTFENIKLYSETKKKTNALRSMFTSEEWATSPHATKTKSKRVMNLVLSDGTFWRPICVIQLVKMLRLVDDYAKPAMVYIYEAMDR